MLLLDKIRDNHFLVQQSACEFLQTFVSEDLVPSKMAPYLDNILAVFAQVIDSFNGNNLQSLMDALG